MCTILKTDLGSPLQIIDSEDALATFQRSVTVPKEAFEKSLNVSVPFAVIFRFNNLTVRKNISISPLLTK